MGRNPYYLGALTSPRDLQLARREASAVDAVDRSVRQAVACRRLRRPREEPAKLAERVRPEDLLEVSRPPEVVGVPVELPALTRLSSFDQVRLKLYRRLIAED